MSLEQPHIIQKKLNQRCAHNSIRQLSSNLNDHIDFTENDYLGFASSKNVAKRIEQIVNKYPGLKLGSTGSRLLSGNHALFEPAERFISRFHHSDTALLFNSGFNANVGLLSSLPQRSDLIFYDEFSHASIRQGLRLSLAKTIKFKHNDLENLLRKINRFKTEKHTCYIVTESVFSMDGDSPDLKALVDICESHGCFLILDEAHALGVLGDKGRGLAQEYDLEDRIFARIMTFGKALGAHGAAILGTRALREFLINFSTNFIYTTALSPHAVAHILAAYQELETSDEVNKLQDTLTYFRRQVQTFKLTPYFLDSETAIQSCVISGNTRVKSAAVYLQDKEVNVKPVLPPTVAKGQERLRLCLNTHLQKEHMDHALGHLSDFLIA